jgi:hypothetical protein
MNFIDPTYLRSIADDLAAGAINKDNPAALPDGLAGIFEKALPPESNVKERKKFLEFFSVWALLKKEVSAAFVVPLLGGWSEEDILDYIARYSKWFNSPESGKYVLFHERFRMFLLLKISERDILRINQGIINLCHESLVKKQADELEYYALEYLSTHLFLTAMNSQETGAALKKLAYDTTHWDRQIELSKGFDWSKKMLNAMLQWAMKWDHNQILECALCKVDLHYLEQNDAQKIVALVVNGEIEVALSRIETFGGADEEGLKRKFILYMLCLMEITLFNSKEKPFRKTAIEKLLNHLDEQIPAGILDWNNFFPSYLMFQMACEWAELDLEYLIVYKRTEFFLFSEEYKWITEKGPYKPIQIAVMRTIAREMSDEFGVKSNLLMIVAVELSKQGKEQEALAIARGTSDQRYKSSTLKDIAVEISKQGHLKYSAAVMQEALAIARGLSDEYEMSMALKDIAVELSKQGQVKKPLAIVRGISDDYVKDSALKDIAVELSKQGRVKKSLAITRGISYEDVKSSVLKEIAVELFKQGQQEEAVAIARGISYEI